VIQCLQPGLTRLTIKDLRCSITLSVLLSISKVSNILHQLVVTILDGWPSVHHIPWPAGAYTVDFENGTRELILSSSISPMAQRVQPMRMALSSNGRKPECESGRWTVSGIGQKFAVNEEKDIEDVKPTFRLPSVCPLVSRSKR
jgi:hypothetical protein